MYACAVRTYIYMPIYMHFCVFTCIDIYFSITWHIIGTAHNICVYGPVYVYTCMYVCMYVCMRMYIYLYMYVYMCIGVCMYIYKLS